MNKSGEDTDRKDFEEILQRKDVLNVYFNEFAIGVSENDLFIILSRNGHPDCILNASHITAKKLGDALQSAVKDIDGTKNGTQ